MKTSKTPNENEENAGKARLTVARTVHPEDLSAGDSVVVAEVTYEFATFAWCGADLTGRAPEDPIRIAIRPHDKHHPMVVEQICLPYVLCKKLDKKHQVVDLRQVRLARVAPEFAKAVRAGYKSDQKTGKSCSCGAKKRKKKKKTKKAKKS